MNRAAFARASSNGHVKGTTKSIHLVRKIHILMRVRTTAQLQFNEFLPGAFVMREPSERVFHFIYIHHVELNTKVYIYDIYIQQQQ